MAHRTGKAKASLARPLEVDVERERARFGAWYELFPRSWGGFKGVQKLLPQFAELGFDVIYLPPIHPIGTTNRKGRNNALVAEQGDPGSPWAIGGREGGHDAIAEELGTLKDFDRLVAAAREQGLEIALDFAIQCSPDHPWLKAHPEWFNRRPDGTLKYAENPPKRYQDIYNVNFDSEDWPALWEALRDVVLHWCRHGVRAFRVDNPHTKSVPFWEWLIREVRADFPETIFFAEAFTRPAMMTTLAKLGFSQSYTYFTWKNTKGELAEFLQMLLGWAPFYRPNFFANTPDILHEYLQEGGPPAFEARLVLASTLSPSYGIYSGYEHFENLPAAAGSEEYLDSEKYEVKQRKLDGPLLPLVKRLNAIRRFEPALQRFDNLRLLNTHGEHVFAYVKGSSIAVAVNLDPRFCTRGRRRRPAGHRPAGGVRRPRPAHRRALPLADRPQLRWPRPGTVASDENRRMNDTVHQFYAVRTVSGQSLLHGVRDDSGTCQRRVWHESDTVGWLAVSEPGHWFESNPLWFKTAVFYEIHTRAFFDGNDDGSGDFRGLMQKLDYLQWLGIDCIWLLPFFPSPLKDGGYDIADFYGINPDYGTVEDFRVFVEAAHERGMRVIADLVMNHTSAEHPWFQESRSDPNGPKGDWYVWSDTDDAYGDARIIFIDTEVSNWTFDPVREQFYWHRFFSHQPDLNYENPEVRDAMLEVLRFWLDVGLDGFRLDAVPYLFEQEGTNCENLPRTHEYLKRVRAEIDEHYPDRVLLAEANQWPEDVVAYFGNGDECHMAFHFPVMPRMFMSLRREEALPMIEILDRTPTIPTTTQWGLFLRNHDELTLEMVTDEERDYMYSEYANDPRMKLNLGIRRRLAPLLDGGRDEIELMHAILFSLPGSPVLYYGDEIAMGDNVYLGDRDGVRTPMQWTGDRNGGFSRADFAQLYLPPLMDPVYGFQAVNIEAQLRTPTSLLRWLRRFVELRKQHPVFGLGDYRVLRPENPKIFAHIRSFSEDIVLCVHNLARSAQAVELDLSAFDGRVPVELFGNTEFPRIGELPYLLTLGPRGFFWFQLQDPADEH